MQAAVVQQPVSIAVEADQSSFQFYSSGVVTSGCGDSLDHAPHRRFRPYPRR